MPPSALFFSSTAVPTTPLWAETADTVTLPGCGLEVTRVAPNLARASLTGWKMVNFSPLPEVQVALPPPECSPTALPPVAVT